MVNQYYTLLKIINDLKALIGMEIIEIFTQEKDTVLMGFADSEDELYLEISTDKKYSTIFLRNNFARARRNTTDLFEELKGEILQDVSIINEDRIVKLELIRSDIYVLLFGRGASNIYVISRQQKIIDAFNNSNEIISTKFQLPAKQEPKKDPTLWEYVSGKPILFGKQYSNIFFEEQEFDKHSKFNDLEGSSRTIFLSKVEYFRQRILNSKEFYLHFHNNNYIFSLLKLGYEVITDSADLSDMIRKKISYSKKDDEFREYSKIAEKKLIRNVKKAESKLKSANEYEKSFDRAVKYKNYGDILISQPHPKTTAGDSIQLEDFGGNKLKISLDEKLTLIENAQKYYEKAKKSEKEAEIKFESIESAEKELEEQKELLERYNSFTEPKQLKKFIQENAKILGINMGENSTRESKFRHFNLDGWDFYVGKNASNNDELTMKFAKPQDLWFHARGVSGSHCIIKRTSKDKIPKEIIKKAAGLAAYYSQSRKGKYIPVAFTEKKYIRKPKGANVGAVIMQKEEVILVDPISPDSI